MTATQPITVVADRLDGEAQEAIALAGGHVAAEDDWTLTGLALDHMAAVLLLEAEGVTPEPLAHGLARIAVVAGERELRIVAVLGEGQIDQVAAALLGLDAVLLVEPTVAERVVALIAAMGDVAPVALREGERERLDRLNAEIARIAQMLVRLSDGAPSDPVARVADGGSAYRARPGGADGGAALDPQVVRHAIRARRMRDTFFPAALFEDPAWDMLLDLFAAELEEGVVSVSSLCIAAAVAPTTALRWIGRMTAGGLLARRPDPNDRRRAFIVLTQGASAGMRGYAAAVARAGVPFA